MRALGELDDRKRGEQQGRYPRSDRDGWDRRDAGEETRLEDRGDRPGDGHDCEKARRDESGRPVRPVWGADQEDRAAETENEAEDLQRREAVAFDHEVREQGGP